MNRVRSGRLLVAGLSVVALARVALGWAIPGFLTGDDVEILEAGFARATGLEFVPWEIRNTLISDLLVAPPVAAASFLGLADTWTLCWVATLPFVALSLVSIVLLHRIAARWTGEPNVALLAAAVYALHWLPFGYAGTVYPRTASTTLVLAAVALLLFRESVLGRVGAGLLLALAFAFRYSEAVFFLPAVAFVMARSTGPSPAASRVRRAAELAGGFLVGVLVFCGLYEWVTRGEAFASLVEFARYTLVERQASARVAEQPVYWYLWRSPKWLDPVALGLLCVAARRRAHWVLLGFVLLPLAVLSLIHHKELRYLQGIIPFACLLLALGAVEVAKRHGKPLVAALLILSMGWSLAQLRFLRRKSTAAVHAAQAVAAQPAVRRFAAPQLWAFGDRLFFGNDVALSPISHPPVPEVLTTEIAGADRVALWADTVAPGDAMTTALVAGGWCEESRFAAGRSRPVVLFRPCR